MRDRIIDREYVSKVELQYSYTSDERDKKLADTKVWREDNRRLQAEFKKDLLEDLGLTGHPKAEDLYRIAWDNSHCGGYLEVYEFAEELAELLK